MWTYKTKVCIDKTDFWNWGDKLSFERAPEWCKMSVNEVLIAYKESLISRNPSILAARE